MELVIGPLLIETFIFTILQESGKTANLIKWLHKSIKGALKTLYRNRPDRLFKPAALETVIFLSIFRTALLWLASYQK